ncbi:MAG: hypothetical protein ABI330_08030 [Caldimonas sp.]
MNRLTLTARLISAATAAAITFLLLSAVVSIAEPQRSVLMAKNQRIENLPLAPTALAVASNDVVSESK